MTPKALAACEKYNMLENGGAVVAALSGGADSTALLHFLYSVKEKYNLTVYAAHLNHGIRGEEADRDELSEREIEILVSVAQGLLNKEIADKHSISINTVITHRKNITRKTGIKTVAGLTVYAILNGYVDINSVK